MYHPQEIERKWQRRWEDEQLYQVNVDHSRPKYYILDMFPYPSGEGLHVGHLVGYTFTDILARYYRQKGYNVLHPMGWDSFGLPAEQYAMRTGVHPEKTTEKNINHFRQQLKRVGLSYDWSREVRTSHPSYYKWTQWIFTQLYERGLAYRAEMMVNYCPHLGTVLANEEVEGGVTKEGGYPVVRKKQAQWVLKITEYAQRLLCDLDLIDWPEHVKTLQKNWIGKSEGVNVHFLEEKTNHSISVFTTRPDTLFGVSYLVLAPEYPLIKEIITPEQMEIVRNYEKESEQKSDRQRLHAEEDKKGVWTGAYALHPLSGAQLPIWISDYVLADYGTGAVMGVPAHDARDFLFAKQHALPICPVILPENEMDRAGATLSLKELQRQILQGKLCWEGEGCCISGECEGESVTQMRREKAAEQVIKWLEERNKGRSVTGYKLRDWLFSRQRYWGEPFPILYLEDGSIRTLTPEELPLIPPQLKNFSPSTKGKSPLAMESEWMRTIDSRTGKGARRESDTMPQWAGSCWYYLRFCDPHNEKAAWGPQEESHWMPVDMYVGGLEHAVLHLLYARFWHKVLYDCGQVSTLEPFQKYQNVGIVVARSFKRTNGGYVDPCQVEKRGGTYFHREEGVALLSQIEKMSKSKLNGISPDSLLEEYGADTIRLFEMFLGPIDREKVWDSQAIAGCYRFLQRVYKWVTQSSFIEEISLEEEEKLLRWVYQVRGDLEQFHCNTAIAKMMEWLNSLQKQSTPHPRKSALYFLQLLFPFAPHICSELWEFLGEEDWIDRHPLPQVDPMMIRQQECNYVIQINGKKRALLSLVSNMPKEKVIQEVQNDPHVQKFLQDKEIKKIIFVPDKLLNFVLASPS